MFVRSSALILALAASVVAACSRDGVTAPSTNGAASGTSADTTHAAPGRVDLAGHVYAMQSTPAGQGSDTLRYIPIAGVPLRLMHNILVNGQSAQELAGTATSDASGAYHFDGIAGGYYVLYANPTAASGYQGAYSLVPALSSSVAVDVFVWKAP